MKQVAVLFARLDSVYKKIPICDVFDQKRDARSFDGGLPVVAHPPCRSWSRLRQHAKPEPGEKELGPLAVNLVRANGGVLEHPAGSALWKFMGLPADRSLDGYGGWTLRLNQEIFGHRARKSTWLYIVGCPPLGLPVMPPRGLKATCTFSGRAKGHRYNPRGLPKLPLRERDATPPPFAAWLVELALRCELGA